MKPNIFLRMFSFIWPIILEKRQSPNNKILEVTLSNGALVLDTEGANYSFGSLHVVMEKAIETAYNKGPNNWQKILILGYGGGSAASIIHKKYNANAHITAVEIDPLVVDLARKWFYSEAIHFEICSAEDYIKMNQKKFDVIICDIFIDLYSPPFIRTQEFYKKMIGMLNREGVFIQNLMLKPNEMDTQSGVFNSVFAEPTHFSMFNTNSVYMGYKNTF